MSETSDESIGPDDAGSAGSTGESDDRETPEVGLIADEELPETKRNAAPKRAPQTPATQIPQEP